ncbi:MAG TPA: 5-nitroimidazole antibiotic resistance protein, partial [Anaerolineaceae bacterium]|nr:5-nitroimidazole antibiotic resistance protein [Anaerolineaceae bacterium]
NDGFLGQPSNQTLPVGTVFERIRSEFGRYGSPLNTPFVAKSLPPSSINLPLSVYEVIKPINNVLVGKISPWFGTYGGGIQYYFKYPVKTYLEEGFLKLIK